MKKLTYLIISTTIMTLWYLSAYILGTIYGMGSKVPMWFLIGFL